MKKGIKILIVIWILLLVGIFVYSKIKNPKKTTGPTAEPPTIETEDLSGFQYIDYRGYYNENDLNIERVYIDESSNTSYMKISGLKDKNLEEQINKELYEMVEKKLNGEYKSIASSISLNAFNVLSSDVSTYDGSTQTTTLNIDLATGKKLTIYDVINIKNIKRILNEEYYDAVNTEVERRKNNNERDINYYNYCLENSCNDFEAVEKTAEEARIMNEKLDKFVENIDEEALKYVRSVNENTEFYLSPFAMVIPNVPLGDTGKTTEIRIGIDKNPRLFNFYYKFKTDESIFDGTYEGTKNMLYVNYYTPLRKPHVKELDNYAVIYYNDREDKVLPNTKGIFDNYVTELDKSKFTAIYDQYEMNDSVMIYECSMTKEIYDATEKNRYFDNVLDSDQQHMPFDTTNENISCRSIKIYTANTDVMEIGKISSSDKELIIKNNPELTEKIKKDTQSIVDSVNKQYGFDYATSWVKEVTEDTIEIETYHRDSNSGRQMYGTHPYSLK